MLLPLICSLALGAGGENMLTLNAPATDALMLLARSTHMNLIAAPVEGKIKGEFPTASKETLVRDVLGQVQSKVTRREDFILVGREGTTRVYPRLPFDTSTRVPPLWEREMTAGQLARVLGLSLGRTITVAAPADRTALSVVISGATAETALTSLAFFLGLPVQLQDDGSIALGDAGAAVTRDCAGFSMSEWTRLSGFAPSAYPVALLQTGGVSCLTQAGQSFRTADGELLNALGADDGAMIYRFGTGAKTGTYARVAFDGYQEIHPCQDLSRESKLKHLNDSHTFAIVNQDLQDCAVSRNTKAGDYEIIDIDARGPYIRNVIRGTKNPVVQITSDGPVGAFAPVQTQ